MGIINLKKVYILHHIHEFENNQENIKLIGVFSSKEKALKVLANHKILPGFKDAPNGFSIDEYTIDRIGWTEGFVTIN